MADAVPVRVVLYARVSTDEQAKGQSPESQLATCRGEAARQGWQVVAEVVDPGVSGRKVAARPGLRRVAELAPTVDVVLATAIDRLHRNKHEWELYKRGVLAPHGVRVHTLTGVSGDGDPASWFAGELLDVNAEFYSRLTSWKTVHGMRRQVENGLWLTKPPYGTQAGTVRGVPVEHPEEWPWLLRIFERAARGDTDTEIARWLTAERAPARRSHGWVAQVVKNLLQRPFYLGEVYFQGKAYPAQHQCRVPRELWMAALLHREDRARSKRPATARVAECDHVYILPRVVADEFTVTYPPELAGQPLPLYGKWCNGRGGKRYHYYYRADKLRSTGGLTAERVRGTGRVASMVPADELERCVVEALAGLSADRLPWALMGRQGAQAVLAGMAEERSYRNAEGARLARERRQLDDLLVRAYSETGVAAQAVGEALRRKLDDLAEREREHAEAVAGLEEEEARSAGLQAAIERAGEQVNLIAALWERGDRPALRRVIGTLVEEVVLRSDGAWLHLRPPLVCDAVKKAALTGIEPVFPP